MNRFSLILVDGRSEREYFTFRLNRFMGSLVLSQLVSLLYFITILVDTFINGIQTKFYISIVWESIMLIQLILAFKVSKQLIPSFLCLNSFILGFLQLQIMEVHKGSDDVFLLSQSLCILQIELSVSHRIVETLITALGILIQKLIISYISGGLMLGQLTMILSCILMMIRIFVSEKQRRNSFLVSQRLKEWGIDNFIIKTASWTTPLRTISFLVTLIKRNSNSLLGK